jgi:uncharacterized protein (TIGR02466 family)
MNEAATIARAEALITQGDAAAALVLTKRLMAGAAPSHLALTVHAGALRLADRQEEALAFDRQATVRFASNRVAWHNYAAALADLGRAPEALAAFERAFSLGMDAPQTFAAYGRALRVAGDHPRAEDAYKRSLMRPPPVAEVVTEYADYVWMLRGDAAEADAVLDAAFHAGAPPTPLLLAKAALYDAAGQAERAAALLEAASVRIPGDMLILSAATVLALRLQRVGEAERYLRQAQAVNAASREVIQYAAIVDLAKGRPGEALASLRGALKTFPDDQALWAWAATAARAAGDPLYGQLCDYGAVVQAYDLKTPEGWPSLEASLGDLAKALKDEHPYREHPINQSLRHGSQSMHFLTGSNAPAVKAFFSAIDAPIREHMAKLGKGADPLRRRNTLDYRIQGAWSVRLRPNGFHHDHVHPKGWLSSAFYVETPDAALESAEKQGWIRFGQPPFITDPPLPAEHFVRPKPGRLVLFPSYMWHGTVPFTTPETRLTVAFDAVPT